MRWLIGTLVALTVLAGCTSVPVDGPIRSAKVDVDSVQPPIPVVPDGPRRGDSRLQIVRGFLGAMAGYQPDYQVAREFLTVGARKTWKPTTIQVHDTDLDPTVQGDTVEITTGLLGTVAADGGWKAAGRGQRLEHTFRFEMVDGGWRIASPPAGLLMSEDSFDVEYNAHNVYFFDPMFENLVPYPIYLPSRGSEETMLVQALLRGPTGWLKNAVHTAFPAGTQLATPSVPVVNNTATVDLDNRVKQLPADRRKLISVQLAWTLRQIHAIDRVRITTERTPLRVDDVGDVQPIDSWDDFNPEVTNPAVKPYAVNHRRVVRLSDDKLRPRLEPVGGTVSQLAVRSVAVSVLQDKVSTRQQEDQYDDRLAVVSAGGKDVSVITPPVGKAEVVYEGHDVLEPSWDRHRQLWMVDRLPDGSAKLLVLLDQTKKGPMEVEAPGLTGDVHAFKVSRDGVRVAALVNSGGRDRLLVGWIDRRQGVSIRGLREIPLPATNLTDMSWASVNRIAVVVGSAPTDVPGITLVTTDGYGQEDVPPANVFADSAATAPGQPVLIGAGGNVYRESTNLTWDLIGPGLAPTYPG